MGSPHPPPGHGAQIQEHGGGGRGSLPLHTLGDTAVLALSIQVPLIQDEP